MVFVSSAKLEKNWLWKMTRKSQAELELVVQAQRLIGRFNNSLSITMRNSHQAGLSEDGQLTAPVRTKFQDSHGISTVITVNPDWKVSIERMGVKLALVSDPDAGEGYQLQFATKTRHASKKVLETLETINRQVSQKGLSFKRAAGGGIVKEKKVDGQASGSAGNQYNEQADFSRKRKDDRVRSDAIEARSEIGMSLEGLDQY